MAIHPEHGHGNGGGRAAGALVAILCLEAGAGIVWPAMYECVGGSGASIFTDSPAQLQQCQSVAPGGLELGVVRLAPKPDGGQALPQTGPAGPVPLPPAAGRASDKSMTVPVQRSGNLLVVQAQLNGSRNTRLILDTGASHTILSQDVARDLGLLNAGTGVAITLKTAGGSVQAEMTRVASLRVGEAEARNVSVAIHDLPDAPAGVDGLLGLTFLSQFLVTLDSQKGELHLRGRE